MNATTHLDLDFAGKIIGLAMKVHLALGPGFLESVYANALEIELRQAGISFEREKKLCVNYSGESVGEFACDFYLESLVLEPKAVTALSAAHEVQLVNYLAASGTEEGLLLNFGGPSLEFKKNYRTYKPRNFVNPVNSISAFTLLELLVAMAVLSILVVMMMGLVSSASALWRQSENRVDAYREARAALTVISRDLGNLVATYNTNYFLVNGDGAFAKLPGDAEKDIDRAGAIFFLSALPAEAQESGKDLSDVCEVGYFAGFERARGMTNSARTLNLYRFFRSSNPTFSNLAAGNNFSGASIGVAGEELLARNIREFRVTPLIYTTNGNYSTNFSPSTNKPVPDALEISITAVNQEAARTLTNKADWTSTNPPSPILQGQQKFVTRVPLNRPQ